MKFISITCDKCGANLEINIDQGYGYCPHCGNKVYADYSDEVLIEKEKTKQKKIELIKQREKKIYKKNKNQSSDESEILIACSIFLWITGSFLVIFIFMFIITYFE